MAMKELCDFYDGRFQQCFRAYFLELGIPLREDTVVFDEITKSHETEGMHAFVIEEDGQYAGFIMIQAEHLRGGFFEERVGFIRELWVAPSFRLQGYGRQLLEAAEAYFEQQNIPKLILTYEEDALAFYYRQGFLPDRSYTARNNEGVLVKLL